MEASIIETVGTQSQWGSTARSFQWIAGRRKRTFGILVFSPVVRIGDAGSGYAGSRLVSRDLGTESLVGPMIHEGWGVVGDGLIF